MIVLWCNGSTADFGSVSLGSNPSRTTKINIKIMTELTLQNIEKCIKEEHIIISKDFIKPLGNGLYKVGDNMICGENMLDELYKEILKEIKK